MPTRSFRDAIARIESGGRYNAIGPTHPKLGRALGRYQVMEANIGPWSREALGKEVTADEFLANPELQDAIFDHRFGQYVQQYGPEGAAQAWFGGPGGVGKTNRKDVLGTSVGKYGDMFMQSLGQSGPSPSSPAGGARAASEIQPFGSLAPSGPMPPVFDNPPSGAAALAFEEEKRKKPGDYVNDAFQHLAAEVGSIRAPNPGRFPGGPSPDQANALASVLNSPTVADMFLKKRMPFLFGG